MEDTDRHLFVIGHNVFKSIDKKSLEQTLDAMFDLGIYHPPFKKIDIRIDSKVKDFFSWINAMPTEDFDDNENISWTWMYDFYVDDENHELFNYAVNRGFGFEDEKTSFISAYKSGFVEQMMKIENLSTLEDGCRFFIENERSLANRVLELLVASLAIKNIEKTTIEHKKFEKIKTNKTSQIYKYITTLKIGKITETYRSDGSSNTTVKPHMRRGHIRNQHFGIGNKEIKKIFIQPVFVNADEGWIANEREHYKVTL